MLRRTLGLGVVLAVLMLTGGGAYNHYLAARHRRLNQAFVDAVEGDAPVEELRFLLDRGADINAISSRGEPVLLTALRNDDEGGVTFLIRRGAVLNVRGESGDTPLIRATKSEHSRLLFVELLRRGAAVNARNNEHTTALDIAVSCYPPEIIRTLIEYGAAINPQDPREYPALAEASEANLCLLLQHGAKVNAVDPVGRTPLMAAAGNGFAESVRRLLEAGADPNRQANNGGTALMRATEMQHLAVVQYLLTHGARVNIRDQQGHTALRQTLSEIRSPSFFDFDDRPRFTMAQTVRALTRLSHSTPADAKRARVALLLLQAGEQY
jgi:ankyrin repeat protein